MNMQETSSVQGANKLLKILWSSNIYLFVQKQLYLAVDPGLTEVNAVKLSKKLAAAIGVQGMKHNSTSSIAIGCPKYVSNVTMKSLGKTDKFMTVWQACLLDTIKSQQN